MSFGQHEYQHRYYHHQPHKKMVALTPYDSRVLPISTPTHQPQQYYTPQLQRHPQNPLNLKVRAGEMAYNAPGWQGYRLKSYIVDKYDQNYRNYQNDKDTIEKFKRQAQEHKRRLRFANRYYEPQNQPHQAPLLPEIRMKTEPPPQELYYPQEQLNNDNPEHQDIHRFDVGIMARIKSPQQHQRRDSTRQSHRKLKEYRKKYSKLKNKLKEELKLHHHEERHSSDYEEKERKNMSRIERLITDVSQRIAKNTIIFNEGLRVQKQLRDMREEQTRSPILSESKMRSTRPKEEANQIHFATAVAEEEAISEQEQNRPRPRIVYNHRQLNDSYEQLSHLKKEISSINERISKNYKHS